jgi:DNA adenine methylase
VPLLNRRPPAAVPIVAHPPRGVLEPVVKWAGGKRKLLPELVARMPAAYGRYYEPFAGGAALYLHIEPEHAVLADTNADLINVYSDVAQRTDALIADLAWHASKHSETFYYEVRERWNTGYYDPPNTNRAAAFLYLNKTCFNGLWRVNADGEFNTPIGDYANPKILNEAELRAAAPAFARATLRTSDFRQTVRGAVAGDFVYFDPPYIPASPTASFTAYTTDGFGEAQQLVLARTALELAVRGVQVMLSNSDTEMAWSLYGNLPNFQIDRVSRSGAISSNTTGRGRVSELIITGGYDRPASNSAGLLAA